MISNSRTVKAHLRGTAYEMAVDVGDGYQAWQPEFFTRSKWRKERINPHELAPDTCARMHTLHCFFFLRSPIEFYKVPIGKALEEYVHTAFNTLMETETELVGCS